MSKVIRRHGESCGKYAERCRVCGQIVLSIHDSCAEADAVGVSESRPVVDQVAVVGENLKPLSLGPTLPESGHPPFVKTEYEKGVCAFLGATKDQNHKKEKADIIAAAKLIAGIKE